MPMLRPALLSAAIAIGCLAGIAGAQSIDNRLPEIGSSAAELISPADEQRYARQMLGEMRRLGWLIDDPLVDAYLRDLGHRLAANSALPGQPFTFFLLRSRQINAFATLGGHVAVNAGLLLTAEREDELAAVVAHEITHVTQRHIARGVESARKEALPIALMTLLAVLAADQAGGDGDAAQAAISSGIALMQQLQINYTRANEHEADRIGIQILARSGYDPGAMADFFGRMLRAGRAAGSGAVDVPELLRTHPVTTTRISEAKDRAAQVTTSSMPVAPSTQPLNPTLPGVIYAGLQQDAPTGPRSFAFARERLRVLSADSPAQAVNEYRRRLEAGATLTDAEHYGHALARMQHGDPGAARDTLQALRADHADFFWIDLALAEAHHRAGDAVEADRLFARLIDVQPGNRAIALTYARCLAERGGPEHGRRAQDVLRPLLAGGLSDPALQQAFARASEQAGDLVRAGEAYAEAAFLSGRAEDALNQLQRLKTEQALDYVQRSRIDARIAAMTPIVLELRAEGIRPGKPQRRAGLAPAP